MATVTVTATIAATAQCVGEEVLERLSEGPDIVGMDRGGADHEQSNIQPSDARVHLDVHRFVNGLIIACIGGHWPWLVPVLVLVFVLVKIVLAVPRVVCDHVA